MHWRLWESHRSGSQQKVVYAPWALRACMNKQHPQISTAVSWLAISIVRFSSSALVQLARRASSLKQSSNLQSVPWDHTSRAPRNPVLKELMWRQMAGDERWYPKGLDSLEPGMVLHWKQCGMFQYYEVLEGFQDIFDDDDNCDKIFWFGGVSLNPSLAHSTRSFVFSSQRSVTWELHVLVSGLVGLWDNTSILGWRCFPRNLSLGIFLFEIDTSHSYFSTTPIARLSLGPFPFYLACQQCPFEPEQFLGRKTGWLVGAFSGWSLFQATPQLSIRWGAGSNLHRRYRSVGFGSICSRSIQVHCGKLRK